MHQDDFINGLFDFIHRSPTAFHAVHNACSHLRKNGFIRLRETENWGRLKPGAYFVSRNDSSLIAFILTGEDLSESGLRLAGAHTDSPCLKVKPNPVQVRHSCLQLGVEVYGGALLAPWFDRDLSLAGRISWQAEDGGLHSSLIDFRTPIATIPSLAIHLDPEANKNKTINKQNDLVPVLMQVENGKEPDFKEILKEQLIKEHPKLENPDILDYELFFHDSQPPARIGLEGDFITGARLDNLISCYTIIQALGSPEGRQNSLIVLNDHEEVGSVSASGARGTFLRSVLERLLPDPAKRQCAVSRSLLISADNAHAVHPNFADKHDAGHLPLMNRGPVIKLNANQRYATNAETAAFFRAICKKAEVPVQEFVMRGDMACGSTIGPPASAETGIRTVDVGVPSLAMHSIRETAGTLDCWSLNRALALFFSLETENPMWQGAKQ